MITISKEAQEYILTKGGKIHILHGSGAAMCCGRINFGPSVSLGEPKELKDYKILMIDGIHVYLPKDFHVYHPFVIGLGSFLSMKSLRVEGWKLV